MRHLPFTLMLGVILALIAACSSGGNSYAEVWQPYTDSTRPTLAFFYTDN